MAAVQRFSKIGCVILLVRIYGMLMWGLESKNFISSLEAIELQDYNIRVRTDALR